MDPLATPATFGWAARLLVVLGAPTTASNLAILAAWHHAEGGHAAFNWLNTTLMEHHATLYNSAGVRNFPDEVTGICATALTLVNGYYPGIVNELRHGKATVHEFVTKHRAEISKWGTNASAISR